MDDLAPEVKRTTRARRTKPATSDLTESVAAEAPAKKDASLTELFTDLLAKINQKSTRV